MTYNGGRIQVNFNSLQTGNEFPFIDHMKTGQQWFQSTDGAQPTPANLDANTGLPVSGPGVATIVFIPSQTDRPGNWIVDWLGNMTSLRTNFSATTVSGATSGVNGSWTFTPTGTVGATTQALRLDIGITSYNASNPITRLRLYHTDDATRIANGEVFSPNFLSTLAALKPGTLRFLNWVSGNTCKAPKWAYRRPTTYTYYDDAFFIPSRDAGSAGGTSSALTCTYPNSEGLTDKILIHLRLPNGVTSGATLNGIIMKGSDGTANFTNSSGRLATCIYDQDLNVWICTDGGLACAVPPEIITQLCNAVGSHCWTHIPYLALDNPANWATPLATHLRDNLGAGQRAIYECNNEVWNSFSGFPGTTYGNSKSTVIFPSTNINDWYGMVCSTNGKAVSDVYSADRTKYDFVCGVQSSTFDAVSNSNRRLTSQQWVALGGGRTAASNWVTAVSVTSYINSLRTRAEEIALAVPWQTANAATQAAEAFNYWAINSAENIDPLPSTFSLKTSYSTWLAWGQAQAPAVNKLFAYEGGNSQDYPAALSDDKGPITAITKGVTTQVTISASTYGNNNAFPLVGMWVFFTGVGGMTQINSMLGLVTGVAGQVITVAIDSSLFSNFTSGGNIFHYMPLNITGITKASSAVITTDGTLGLAPNTGYFCFVTGVSGMVEINGLNASGTRTSNTVWTANINSSGFTTYTSGGLLLVPTTSVRKDFRVYTRKFYRIYDIEYINMQNFATVTGETSGQFASLYELAGVDQVWPSLQPTIYGNDAQKFDAFRLYSNRKRRMRIKTG